jgi:hypothetical protein
MPPAPITLDTKLVVTDRQVSNEVGDEAVILDVEDGMYYGLNAVGARVWSLLQEPRTVAEICDAIAAEYDVERPVCERDVLSLVDQLAGQRLVERSE